MHFYPAMRHTQSSSRYYIKTHFSVLDDDKSISAENNENKTHLYKQLCSVCMKEFILPNGIKNQND